MVVQNATIFPPIGRLQLTLTVKLISQFYEGVSIAEYDVSSDTFNCKTCKK